MSTERRGSSSTPQAERGGATPLRSAAHLERTTEDHVLGQGSITHQPSALLQPTEEHSQSDLYEYERLTSTTDVHEDPRGYDHITGHDAGHDVEPAKSSHRVLPDEVMLPAPPCDLETYTITQLSAEGGTARIYRALESHSKDHVAIKLLRRRFHSDPIISTLFLRHGAALKHISLPHFANVLDAGVSEWGPWWAIEWVEGKTLREVIDQGAHWNSEQLLRLMINLCDALEGLHQLGITHGDLSPQNIMYTPPQRASDVDKVTLIDVALPIATQYYTSSADRPPNTLAETEVINAEDLETEALEAAAFDAASPDLDDDTHPPYKVFGQPCYIAPECFRGKRPDQRSDLYSFGVILFELTTGTLPFTSSIPGVIFEVLNQEAPVASIRQTPWPYPPALDALIGNLLSKSPRERCASVAEVRAQLEQMRHHLGKRHELNMTEEVMHVDLGVSSYQFEDTLSDSMHMTSAAFLRPTLSGKAIREDGQSVERPHDPYETTLPEKSAEDHTKDHTRSHDTSLPIEMGAASDQLPPYTPRRSSLKSARRAHSRLPKSIRSTWVINLVWMLVGMLLTFLIRYLYF